MKKLFAILLALTLVLAGCSGEAPAPSQEPSAAPSEPAEPAPAPSQEPSAAPSEPAEPEPAPETEPASEPGADLTSEIAAVMENESDVENIWRGGGLAVEQAEYVPDENYQCFVPVADDRFADTAALRAYTESVFTAEYAQETFYVYGLDAEIGARYRDVDGVLCEDIGQGGGLSLDWNLDSIVVVEESADGCVAEIDYINYDSTYTSVISFTRTENGLRISGMEEKAAG